MTRDGDATPTEAARLPGPGDERTVMAAVDRSGSVPQYVIADVSVDDAWIAVPEAAARPLHAWR